MALVCCHANLLGPIIFILDSDITRQYYTPPSQSDLVSRGSGWNSGNCGTSIKCKILQNVFFSFSWLWLVFGSGKKKNFVKVISVVVVCSLFLIFFLSFRHHEWSKGHAPTNYAKWRTATTRYTVCNENKWCAIGPLQLAIPVLQNRHTGEQEIQWCELSDWLVLVNPLLSSMAVLYNLSDC